MYVIQRDLESDKQRDFEKDKERNIERDRQRKIVENEIDSRLNLLKQKDLEKMREQEQDETDRVEKQERKTIDCKPEAGGRADKILMEDNQSSRPSRLEQTSNSCSVEKMDEKAPKYSEEQTPQYSTKQGVERKQGEERAPQYSTKRGEERKEGEERAPQMSTKVNRVADSSIKKALPVTSIVKVEHVSEAHGKIKSESELKMRSDQSVPSIHIDKCLEELGMDEVVGGVGRSKVNRDQDAVLFRNPGSPLKPKKKKHKPEPLFIPTNLNQFGFQSRLRSPRLWEGPSCTGLGGLGGFKNGFTPPPYTPPPMLSPARSGSGLFWTVHGGFRPIGVSAPPYALSPVAVVRRTDAQRGEAGGNVYLNVECLDISYKSQLYGEIYVMVTKC